MFLNRVFNLIFFIAILVVFSTGQVAASARNNPNDLKFIKSSILLSGKLKPASGFFKDTLSGTTSFTGSGSGPDHLLFTTTGNMIVRRSWHSALLLTSGKVLVAGGFSNMSYLASAELYDPLTETWSSTGSLNVARCNAPMILLNNGKVLIVGGYPGGSSYLSNAELYDPVTGTWSLTGSMGVGRGAFTATLLNNGKVLVTGGDNGSNPISSAELYDPDTGAWSYTGSMTVGRAAHTATLLNNGKVLVAGGGDGVDGRDSAELYDPNTGTWSSTGNMNLGRSEHLAILLTNGKVLVVQGYHQGWQGKAELYNPDTGTWSETGSLNIKRFFPSITLMNNGKVLIEGGTFNGSPELYDPSTGIWNPISTSYIPRWSHTATLLNSGKVLLTGGEDSSSPPSLVSTELATLIPSHVFTGTLTLPSGWTNGTFDAEFVGATSTIAINAGSLSNDNVNWGNWITTTSDVPVTTTWTVSQEGANRAVYLRLRDINGQIVTVVTGSVNVDLTAPTSSMTQLPSFVGSENVPLSWSGTDTLSGIATYDLQARAEFDGQWTDVLTNTTETSYIFNGIGGTTYYFRVRAKDLAGNVESWRGSYDTSTVGTDYGFTINDGELFTNNIDVILTIAGKPETSKMQIANDGGFAGALWETYTSHKNWKIIPYGNYVIPRVVYVRYKDINGNLSPTYQDDIILDVTPPTGSVIIESEIFNPSADMNGTNVTLLLSATDDVSGVSEMIISNHLNFADASWHLYATSVPWMLDENNAVYVRFKDNAGNVSPIYFWGGEFLMIHLPLIVH